MQHVDLVNLHINVTVKITSLKLLHQNYEANLYSEMYRWLYITIPVTPKQTKLVVRLLTLIQI
jgi:hypothetical protein